MQRYSRLTILGGCALVMLLLAGCGNKGALYLPDAPAEPQSYEQSASPGNAGNP